MVVYGILFGGIDPLPYVQAVHLNQHNNNNNNNNDNNNNYNNNNNNNMTELICYYQIFG